MRAWRAGYLFACVLVWAGAGDSARATGTGEHPRPPLSAAEIKSAARGLAAFIPVRRSCGEGARFAGKRSRVTSTQDAWDTARRDEATNTVCQQIGAQMRELNDVLGRQEIPVVLTSSCANLFRGFYLSPDYREAASVERARNDMSNIRGWLAAFQGTANDVVNGTRLARPANDAERAKAQSVLTKIGQVRAKLQSITPAFNAAKRAADCQEAELNIRFWVAKAARAETPVESDGSLVDTFGGHDIVVEGGHCHNLDEFGGALENVLRLTSDTTDILTQNWEKINGDMDDLTREERAVVVQMTADYVKRHGGSNGHLSRTQREFLSSMILATVERFVQYHNEHATNPVPPPHPVTPPPAAT